MSLTLPMTLDDQSEEPFLPAAAKGEGANDGPEAEL